MFEENSGLSETGTCTGDFCPISPELLDSLSSEEVANADLDKELLNPVVNSSEQNLQTEILQTLRYLEDRIIAMGEQLDQLLDSSSSTELSAIAQSYTLLEQGKGTSTLKLLEPKTQPAREYFERQARQPHPSIIDCFLDLRKKLLIVIDSESHEISLLFAFRPSGQEFEPIRRLRLCECSWLIKQFRPSEFRFGFVRICDLREIAWAVALAYRELGYSCRIECGAEVVDVDELILEAEPSAIWMQLEEVKLCA